MSRFHLRKRRKKHKVEREEKSLDYLMETLFG